jgi:hypothetical protein
MKNFIKLVNEINKTLNEIILFETVIHTILLFLIVYLFLSLFNLFPIGAAVPAAVYFLMAMRMKMKKNKIKMVENKYDPLKEKLRTAADNVDLESPVVDELQNEVIREMKHVGIAEFLQTKNISYKVFAAIFLSFIIVFTSTFNVQLIDLKTLFGTLPEIIEYLPIRKSPNAFVEVNTTEDIYGDSSLAVLGNKELDIKIQPVNFEISVKDTGDIEQKQFDEIFPSDVDVKGATAFEENVPQDQQELVKSYFKKLAQG